MSSERETDICYVKIPSSSILVMNYKYTDPVLTFRVEVNIDTIGTWKLPFFPTIGALEGENRKRYIIFHPK